MKNDQVNPQRIRADIDLRQVIHQIPEVGVEETKNLIVGQEVEIDTQGHVGREVLPILQSRNPEDQSRERDQDIAEVYRGRSIVDRNPEIVTVLDGLAQSHI